MRIKSFCGFKNVELTNGGFLNVLCEITGEWAQIEHYSGELLDSTNEKTKIKVKQIVERCKFLNDNNIKLSSTSVIWRYNAFSKLIKFLKENGKAQNLSEKLNNSDIINGGTTETISLKQISAHLDDESVLSKLDLKKSPTIEIELFRDKSLACDFKFSRVLDGNVSIDKAIKQFFNEDFALQLKAACKRIIMKNPKNSKVVTVDASIVIDKEPMFLEVLVEESMLDDQVEQKLNKSIENAIKGHVLKRSLNQ